MLDLAQLARRLATARHRHLAPRVAQPFVDRMDRQPEMPRHRLGVIAADKQPQRLFLLFGESVDSRGHRRACFASIRAPI